MGESNNSEGIIQVLIHRLVSIVSEKGSEASILSSDWLVTIIRALKCFVILFFPSLMDENILSNNTVLFSLIGFSQKWYSG